MTVAAVDRAKRPDVNLLATPIDKAIAFGCNAPNPHNTQAWKFRNTSELETVFYVDEERLLPVTDPPARQIHIGCGCFIETLSVGVTTMHFGTTVESFPEGMYGLDEVGTKPVARITLTPGAEDRPDSLADYVDARQTNRRPTTGGSPVSDEQFAEITKAVRASDVEVIGINNPARMTPLLAIFDRAMTTECETLRESGAQVVPQPRKGADAVLLIPPARGVAFHTRQVKRMRSAARSPGGAHGRTRQLVVRRDGTDRRPRVTFSFERLLALSRSWRPCASRAAPC